MTELLKWMAESPFLTFFLAYFAFVLLRQLVRTTERLIGLPFRFMNIRKHGWPPEHLDADGDYKKPKPEPKAEEAK